MTHLIKILFISLIFFSASSVFANATESQDVTEEYDYLINESRIIQSLLIGIEADEGVKCDEDLEVKVNIRNGSFVVDTVCRGYDRDGDEYVVIINLSGFRFDNVVKVYTVNIDYAP